MVQSKQKGKRGDIVALKGKTTFELTDVNTGEVEVIEDSNMITNGLQEILRTYGYFGCDILNNDNMRILVESLKRLYKSGRVTKEELLDRVASGKISQEEYEYIASQLE